VVALSARARRRGAARGWRASTRWPKDKQGARERELSRPTKRRRLRHRHATERQRVKAGGGAGSRRAVGVGEPADGGGLAMRRVALEVRQVIVLGPALRALVLHAQENRQAAQRGVARGRVGVAHRAFVFAEGDVAAVVRAAFDRRPVLALGGEQLRGGRRGGRAAGEAEDDGDGRLGRVGRLPDVALEAQQLRGAGEAGGERGGIDSPQTAPFAPAVLLVEGLGVGVRLGVGARLRRAELRGKNRRASAWRRGPRGWVGCLWPARGSRRLFRKRGTARGRAGSARRRR